MERVVNEHEQRYPSSDFGVKMERVVSEFSQFNIKSSLHRLVEGEIFTDDDNDNEYEHKDNIESMSEEEL